MGVAAILRRIECEESDGPVFDKPADRVLTSDVFAFGERAAIGVERVPIGMEGTPGRGRCAVKTG
jgi:hypothetical protein